MFLDSLLLLDSIVIELNAEITAEISWINIGEQILHINSYFGMFRQYCNYNLIQSIKWFQSL